MTKVRDTSLTSNYNSGCSNLPRWYEEKRKRTLDSLILTAMTCFLWRIISTNSSHSSTSLASCMAVFTCR